MSALEQQVGGSHYKDVEIQPVQIAYSIGATPLWLKVCKYITRDKENKVEDFGKAIHCAALENDLMELRCQKYIAELVPFEHMDIKAFAEQYEDSEFISEVLQKMYFGYYKTVSDLILERMKTDEDFNKAYEG